MSDDQIYIEYSGTIEELFKIGDKYTFLVGAGISMDEPTNMPSADLNSIGKIYEILGDPGNAIEFFNKSMNIFIAIGQNEIVEDIRVNIEKLKSSS